MADQHGHHLFLIIFTLQRVDCRTGTGVKTTEVLLPDVCTLFHDARLFACRGHIALTRWSVFTGVVDGGSDGDACGASARAIAGAAHHKHDGRWAVGGGRWAVSHYSGFFLRQSRLAGTVEANDRDLQMTCLSMIFYCTGSTILISLYTDSFRGMLV